ncbi:MAG: hypothetical protein MJZ81_07585 [Bacteroidales bacterium]|nr:hypothetical protein [Bacteroidales bacterium]
MLLGANLLFPEKKGGLPYDAEVEYLQGDGQAYILDDRIVLNGAATVRLDVALTDLSYNQDLLGYYVSAKKASGFRFGSSGLVVRYAASNRVSLAIDAESRYTISGSNSESSILDEDGTILATGSAVTSWTTPLAVFCATSSSASPYARYTATNPSTARVYKIEIESESVNADLIPVRKGSVGYMYDRVSGKLFGNAGTGSFIVGPDKGLPYDAEVEYLQSDGTAYIDTGICFASDTRYSYEAYIRTEFTNIITSGSGNVIVGAGVTASVGVAFYQYVNRRGSFVYASPTVISSSMAQYIVRVLTGQGRVDAVLDVGETSSTVYADGIEMGTVDKSILETELWSSQSSICIFTYKYGEYGTVGDINGDVQVHSCHVRNKKTGDEVDLIPVRKGGVGYMYDKISGQLFGNAADSGAFIIGPDK